jgi:hypothetical protein
MKKIIKVNGIFTNQDTIDNRMKLTGQNMLNLGLQSAAAAANS